jgi:hypothetical protein
LLCELLHLGARCANKQSRRSVPPFKETKDALHLLPNKFEFDEQKRRKYSGDVISRCHT